MHLICPRCQAVNESDAHFCKTCGTGFKVVPIRRNSMATPLLIILAVVAVCGFCGIFSWFTGDKTEIAANVNTAAKSFTGGAPTATASPEPDLADTSVETTKTNASSVKSALVISENANLRQTPDAGGAVIETLAANTATEVIRQKGAWFYVRAGEKTGWLHGNTIRLTGRSETEAVSKTPGKIAPIDRIKADRREIEEVDSVDFQNGDATGSSRYVTGPRGGCYYINRNGNKTYVDRSLCGGTSTSSKNSSSSGGYIRGPRGGCYYINRNGNKTYVDRSLCD